MLQLSPRVFVVPGGTNIGIILRDDGTAMLIDSGLNDTPARKVLRAVREELGTDISVILNTHGHADHFGGNAWLVKRTRAKVIAPQLDAMMLQFPLLQAAMLYGGADPVDALRTSFLVADPSPVDDIVDPNMTNIADVPISIVQLPGHSVNQLGYVIDDVFFCADVVFPAATLEKYPIPYLYGLTDHFRSLDLALTVKATHIVLGHGDVFESLDEPVARNRHAIDRTIDAVLNATRAPSTSDDVCCNVFRKLNVPVSDAQSYFLLRPTIQAYLSHLERVGAISLSIEGSNALWQRT